MTNEECDRQNHRFLCEFLELTDGDFSQVTGSVKSTVAQFLMNFRKGIIALADNKTGFILTSDMLELQIQELRKCIVDLQKCLNKLKEGVTIQ